VLELVGKRLARDRKSNSPLGEKNDSTEMGAPRIAASVRANGSVGSPVFGSPAGVRIPGTNDEQATPRSGRGILGITGSPKRIDAARARVPIASNPPRHGPSILSKPMQPTSQENTNQNYVSEREQSGSLSGIRTPMARVVSDESLDIALGTQPRASASQTPTPLPPRSLGDTRGLIQSQSARSEGFTAVQSHGMKPLAGPATRMRTVRSPPSSYRTLSFYVGRSPNSMTPDRGNAGHSKHQALQAAQAAFDKR